MSWKNAKVVSANVNPDSYHTTGIQRGDPSMVVSSSTLRQFGACPSRWLHGYNSPDSESKKYGSVYDCLLLTPDQFAKRYVVQPEVYKTTAMRCPKCGGISDSQTCSKCKTPREKVEVEKPWNNNSTTCAAWVAERNANGQEVVTQEVYANAQAAVLRLREDEVITRWHEQSDVQVWVTADWVDDATGLVIPCQCLMDYVPRADSEFSKCAGDLKSTRNASPRVFRKFAYQCGYHIQAAFDLDMLNAATGENRTTWCFILQENFPPFEYNRAMFGEDGIIGEPAFLDLGREAKYNGYRGLLRQYAQCLKTGKWPGYAAQSTEAQGWSVLYPEGWMGQESPKYEEEEEVPL